MFTFLFRCMRLVLALVFAIGLAQSIYPKSGGGVSKLLPSQWDFYDSPLAFSCFGWNVAMAGKVAVAVAPYGLDTYIYERTGSTWNMVQSLPQSFGVATDGQRVLIEKPTGSAVQVWSGPGQWSLEAALSVGPPNYPFGEKDLDLFGDFIVATGTDAVEVFERQAGTWNPAAMLVGSDTQPGDEFGRRVAIYDRVVVVGAPQANGGIGAAYVFQRVGSQWIETEKIEPPGGQAGWEFGKDQSTDPQGGGVHLPERGSDLDADGHADSCDGRALVDRQQPGSR